MRRVEVEEGLPNLQPAASPRERILGDYSPARCHTLAAIPRHEQEGCRVFDTPQKGP